MRDATESQAQQKTVKLSVQTEQQSGHVQCTLQLARKALKEACASWLAKQALTMRETC